MINKKIRRVKTPCIGVCSTGIGDSVCRGCKRFAHEVIDWNAYTEVQRELIFERLNVLLIQVVSARLQVFDPHKLHNFIATQNITVHSNNDFVLIFTVLKVGAAQIDNLDALGCSLKPEHRGKSPLELREEIDNDFYTLSCAHYERYFPH